MLEPEAGIPHSALLEVNRTSDIGRAVFAKHDLPHGQVILTTSGLLSPISHLIWRPYKREVCATCFKYDRGRDWKIRHIAAGVSFCSLGCESEWSARNTGDLLLAQEVVEASIKKQAKRNATKKPNAANGLDKSNVDADQHKTIQQHGVDLLWKKAETQAAQIREARLAGKASKIVRKASEISTDPDILAYVLSGVLTAYETGVGHRSDNVANSDTHLPMLFALSPDNGLFLSSPQVVDAYTAAYVTLTAILPVMLLPYATISLTQALADRASHNAFSIRPFASLDAATTDDEYLGWGVWPQASFFNHSCRPNVRKERIGRSWRFIIDAVEGVQKGEELRITYLGGDERDLNLEDRRSRLRAEWGFECMCQLCVEESC